MPANLNMEYTWKILNIFLLSMTIVIGGLVPLHAAPSPDIIVYGNDKCGFCKETMQWLQEQNITFVYRDVEISGTNQDEMFAKLDNAGFTTTAYFPVLDIKGQILMKPKFNDIKKALSGEKITDRSEKKIRDPKWRPQKNKSLRSDFYSVKNKVNKSDIIFYDDGSGSGKTLLNQMTKESIPFTIRQLNKLGNASYFDMSSRLAALGYGNTTLFPVVEVKGEMIMKPSLDDVKVLIIEMIGE